MSNTSNKKSIGKAPCYRDPDDGTWTVSSKVYASGILKTTMKEVYLAHDPQDVLNAVPTCEFILGYPWIALKVLENNEN